MEAEKPLISQKEYLKRYLSKDKSKKKKKKEKISSSSHLKRSVIIDDDLGLKDVANVDDEEFNLDYLGDEAPQIAGIVDERPAELRAKEKYSNSLWRDLDEGNKEDNNQHSLTKESKTVIKSNHINDSDSDLSLPRSEKKQKNQEPIHCKEKDVKFKENFRKRNSDSDMSPKRKYSNKHHNSDSDMSPTRSSRNNETDFKNKNSHHAKSKRYTKENSDSDDQPSKKSNVRDGDNPRRKTYEIRGRQNNYNTDSYKRKKVNEGENTSFSKNKKGKEYVSDSDQSPERNRYQKKKDVPEKLKRKEYANDSDLSPARDIFQNRKNSEKLKRKDFRGNDMSPERDRFQTKRGVSEKLRPNKYGNISDSDSSPARDRDQKRKEPKEKYKRKEKEDDSDSDLSPVRGRYQIKKDISEKSKRREQRGDSDSDLSPERYRYQKARRLPEKRRRKAHSDTDLSPVRDRHKSEKGKDRSQNRPELMIDGKKSGLQSASKLREELKRLKETENKLYKKMDPSLLGARAEPIQRDRQTGLIRNLEREKEEERAKAEKRAETEKKYYKWGKGLKQMQDKEDNLADALHEMSKPLARYRDDKDLDAFLRAQEREGDPMLEYIKNKQTESHNVIDLATGSEKPKYNGSFMPNRFGIKPGYRWDGVDRSNGYEKKWFEQKNARKAIEEQAYKWSTSDM